MNLAWGTPYAAVFQEQVDGNPQKYRTHYLFSDEFSQKAQIPLPTVIETPKLDVPVVESPLVEPTLPYSLKNIPPAPKPVPTLPSEKTVQPIASQVQSPANASTIVEPLERSIILAHYEKATLESVGQILKKYKSIPGGVTLEGVAKGFPEIKSVKYDNEKNTFILNGKLIYQNPLSKGEMKQIFKAVQSDDLIGVSLGDKDIIYGALDEGSLTSIYLKLADHFLGSIVFANYRWVTYQTFPGGYKPKANFGAGQYYAVYFNFDHFNFEVKNNKIRSKDSLLTATLIPLTAQQDAVGGYHPDYAKIEKSIFPKEYEDNIQHIVNNMPFYQDEGRVRKANAYGEAAAFARTLNESPISLSELIEKL
jgi:hypothetical protein